MRSGECDEEDGGDFTSNRGGGTLLRRNPRRPRFFSNYGEQFPGLWRLSTRLIPHITLLGPGPPLYSSAGGADYRRR